LSIDEKLVEEEEWRDAEIVFAAEDYIYSVEQVREASNDDCQRCSNSDRQANQCFSKSLIALGFTFRLQFKLQLH
jgi:hypothetical protein